MKPYKACDPEKTIHNIREELFSLGLILKERHYNSELFYACKVSICNKGLEGLNIASNGKGMNSLYSLASAYAEFMERLQNNMLFENQVYGTPSFLNSNNCDQSFKNIVNNKKLALHYHHDPREKEISVSDSVNSNFNFYEVLFPFISQKDELLNFINNDLNFNTLLSIPFHSVTHKEEVYLPIELIHAACGSTGMCAGNSKEEALIQGFCEIFERYVGRVIYYENITPPDISIDYFKNTNIYEKILKLNENKKYTIKIKDCSLGKGIPVIGFLIIDTENRKYNFHLGSSLSPEIALERCLTEIHQNPNGIYWLDINMTELYDENMEKDEFIFLNGNQIFVYGIGFWPNSIFFDKPSYEFQGINLSLNQSDQDDILFIKRKVAELGFNIYIRDVSFLGFPSYYIVIPGMSEYPIVRKHYHYLGNLRKELKKIRNLKQLSEDELRSVSEELNSNYNSIKFIKYRFQNTFLYNTNADINDLDIELLLFMLNYRLKNLSAAYKFISIFLNNKDFSAYKYYYGIRDYLSLALQNKKKEEIQRTLEHIYKEETDEIVQDLEFPEKVFQYHEWPTCFICEKCEVTEDCKYLNSLQILKKIQEKQAEHLIDHSKIII